MREATPNRILTSRIETKPSWRNSRLQRRLPEIDGLRGTAILMVVSFHYLVSIDAPRFRLWEWATRSTGLFQTGVDLFFVLSGFLIAGILIDSRESPHLFKTFYARRIHRIFPLYCVWLGLFYLGIVFRWDQKWGVHLFTIAQSAPLWIYLVFLQNNAGVWFGALTPVWVSATWSLAVEEQFYALLPAIVRAVNRTALGSGAAVVIVFSPLLRLLVHIKYAWQFFFGQPLGRFSGRCGDCCSDAQPDCLEPPAARTETRGDRCGLHFCRVAGRFLWNTRPAA